MVSGKEFENDVCHLLRLQGWQVVPEHLLDHKKIDAYAEKLGDFGQKTRVAVECKDYSSPMSQQQVTQVYTNYLPLIQKGLIDRVVLVTRCDIAPSAKTYAMNAQGMVHVTYIDLLNSLLDFSSYIQGIIAQYLSDEVCNYYVRQGFWTDSDRYKGRAAVEDAILDWIVADDPQPIAVLAGYGMGKTTLAKRMAFLLAERHKADPRERIPIMIRLEEIGSEQSLEGLIGKHFTSSAIVRNYNFHAFMELNKRGRFVIFLDGFDEMKYAMSWEAMRFNIQQLNRLVTGDSKVILGGRPSAFLSQEEHLEALHGRRRILGIWKQLPGWPDYKEFCLLPFSEEQIREFIESYTSVLRKQRGPKFDLLPDSKDMVEFSSQKHSRLFRLAVRPVQLKMLLEVLPTWDEDLDSLTVTVLYSEFIDLIIRREVEKLARRQYSVAERRDFVRDLAWWMWSEKSGVVAVTASEIPERFFSKFMKGDQDLPEVKRDLLSAGFIEVKQPEGYYFPHRSFQEFLVADKLALMVEQTKFPTGKLPTGEGLRITPEVMEFFAELFGEHRLNRLVWNYRGVLPDWFVNSLLYLVDEPRDLLEDQVAMRSPWSYLLIAIGIHKQRWQASAPEVVVFLQKLLESPPQRARAITMRKWAKFLVILNVMLSPYLREVGCEENARMRELLSSARTESTFLGRERVPGSSLLSEHRSRDFCCLASWITQGWDFGHQSYNFKEKKRKR